MPPISVTEVTLIGSMGHQLVFSGNQIINLLDLANYEQRIAFGEVQAGSYTKIRLRVENVELVDKYSGEITFASLPANGKIDLLDQSGFAVFPEYLSSVATRPATVAACTTAKAARHC